jgi:hypothetical protein
LRKPNAELRQAAAINRDPGLVPLTGDLLQVALPAVLEHYNITDWDVLIIGDGSGYSWDIGGGWAGVVIDRVSMGRKLYWGAWSTGTIMISEMMAYVHGLAWYDNLYAKARRQQLHKGVLNVHVICDNETIVKQGNHEVGRNKMIPWWNCWMGYLRTGYTARFHQVSGHNEGRQLGLNVLCDHISRYARLLVQDNDLAKMVPEIPDINVYDINPA